MEKVTMEKDHDIKTVGLLGAGVMGAGAGNRVLEAGYRLVVHDPTPRAREWAREAGAEVLDSPVLVADEADLVLMFLPGPKQITDCVCGPKGILTGDHPCRVIVDLATSLPETSRAMAEAAADKKVGYLDAPVLGRPSAIGKWALPVGGRPEDIEYCRPVLELFAARIMHVGDVGSGHTIKLLNQMMFGAINAMTAEMLAVAHKMGLSPQLVYETITSSQAGTVSNLFKELGARVVADDYANPTFSVDLLIKDVQLGLDMAANYGAPPLLGRLVSYLNETARAQGYGCDDTAVMWKAVEALWAPPGA